MPPTEAAPSRTAYLDPVAGVAGDMLLGALVGAGLDPDALRRELTALHLDGWELRVSAVTRAGLAATRVEVVTNGDSPPRTLRDILELLAASSLPDPDRAVAERVFRLIGEAEAAVHGAPSVEDTHLHEVAAVDALVDVVGVISGLHLLGVVRLACGPLPLGAGSVRAAHGRLPVPAPAVLEIAARAGVPLAPRAEGEPSFELVTPTGIALVAALATFERPPLTLDRVAAGAGARDIEGWPNVCRLWLGRPEPSGDDALTVRRLVVLEANVDDMLPEHVPYLEERLRAAGARDVWSSAVQMKKGRPGLQLTAVADANLEVTLAQVLLEHSSTLGVRATAATRYEAPREVLRFASSLGPAAVKVRRLPGRPPSVAPEYEYARALADQHSMPIAEIYRVLTAESLARLDVG